MRSKFRCRSRTGDNSGIGAGRYTVSRISGPGLSFGGWYQIRGHLCCSWKRCGSATTIVDCICSQQGSVAHDGTSHCLFDCISGLDHVIVGYLRLIAGDLVAGDLVAWDLITGGLVAGDLVAWNLVAGDTGASRRKRGRENHRRTCSSYGATALGIKRLHQSHGDIQRLPNSGQCVCH